MDLFELKKQIQTGALYNYYIFAGEETGIMNIYINQIDRICKLPIEKCDTVQAVYERIKKPGLVSNNKLFIVMDDKSFMKNEKLWSIVPKMVRGNRLILIYTKIDKRGKFFKQNDYVAFNPLPSEILGKYICKDIKLSESNARILADICECSYNRCLQEVDKIKSYLGYRESINDAVTPDMAFRLMLNDGTIRKPIGDITFDVVDAIMDRNNVAKIEKLMQQVKAKHEPRLLLLSLLYTNFRNLFIVQSLGSSCSDYEKVTGLTKFQINQARRNLGKYDIRELRAAMDIIQEMEYGVKVGLIEEEFSLDYLIAQIV